MPSQNVLRQQHIKQCTFHENKQITDNYFSYNPTVNLCVDEGWIKKPHLAESNWTLGLGEAEHLLHIE